METEIREILAEHARLPVDVASLDDDADLYQAGMTSHASVSVMLFASSSSAIEPAFVMTLFTVALASSGTSSDRQ